MSDSAYKMLCLVRIDILGMKNERRTIVYQAGDWKNWKNVTQNGKRIRTITNINNSRLRTVIIKQSNDVDSTSNDKQTSIQITIDDDKRYSKQD